MSENEIWEFLDSKPGWAALTTLDADGFPHTVAIGYFRLDQVLYCGCRAQSHKCRNLERDSRASLMVESGRQRGELKGVLVQGRARVIEDPQELLAIKQRLALLKGEEPPAQVNPGIAYIEILPVRIRSWNR